MKVCNNCEKEYSESMNLCEVCGEELADVNATEDAESPENPKEEQLGENQVTITKEEENELNNFLDEMCSIENREVLKELISGTGVEWFGKNKEFMKEVMDKFAEFKSRKNNQVIY